MHRLRHAWGCFEGACCLQQAPAGAPAEYTAEWPDVLARVFGRSLFYCHQQRSSRVPQTASNLRARGRDSRVGELATCDGRRQRLVLSVSDSLHLPFGGVLLSQDAAPCMGCYVFEVSQPTLLVFAVASVRLVLGRRANVAVMYNRPVVAPSRLPDAACQNAVSAAAGISCHNGQINE